MTTKTQTTHTPTPWYVNGSLIAPTRTGKRFAIAEIFRDNVQTAKANAAFIVRCVNSHAALVEAVEDARDTLIGMGSPDKTDYADVETAITRFDAALRLAKGQE